MSTNRAARRHPAEPGLKITIDDKSYVIRQSELTGLEVKDFRAKLGFGIAQCFADPSVMDLDSIAGLIWLVRRRQDRTITYEAVAGGLNYGSEIDLNETGSTGQSDAQDDSDDAGEVGDDDPEV